MLGRQKFRLNERRGRNRKHFAKALAESGATVDLGSLAQDDGYSEAMFRGLGFGEIETLDFSDFENASLTWDLNQPVPEDWHGQFGFIYDGGTLEHVFDVAQSFRNVGDMLAPGGRFVSLTPFNGYPGHGFYQFSPELVWTYWKNGQGYEVHACRALEIDGTYQQEMPEPRAEGTRVQPKIGAAWRGRMPATRVALWYEVEKTETSTGTGAALQSDYQARWAVGVQ